MGVPRGSVETAVSQSETGGQSWRNAQIEWLKRQDGVYTKRPLAPFSVRNIVACVRTFISDVRGREWAAVVENPFVDPFVRGRTAGAQKVCGEDTIIHLTAAQASQFLECSD